MTKPDSRNVATTKALYAAVPAGDAATVFANVDPEIHVTYYGTEEIPYAGDFHGLDGMRRFLEAVGGNVEVVRIEPRLFIEEGDHLAVWGDLVFRTKRGGREFGSEFAHVITLRDGKWLRFRDFFNSALAARTFAAES